VAEEEVDEDASEISRLQEQLAAQNARLVAFEQEGQALAKKQADMEKLVRRTKAEYKGRDSEIAELEKVKSSLEKVVAEQQAALKLKESSASNASKSLSALQAASQASADKLGRMQQELDSVTDELAATKAALAKAQEEAASQQQKLNTVTQEQALLKRQVDASQSEVLETDAQRRDVESREGMLRATNAQLQEGLAHHMADAAAREERLRDELQDMRKRWQDALSTREALAAEMSGASAPLLRQLSQLQETLRTRSDGWQVTESALSERALRAESAREVAEHKYSVTVEAAHVAQAQLAGAQEKIALLQQQYTDAQHTVERVRVAEQQAQAASREATAALSLEAAQLRGLQQSVREMEVSHEAALVKLAATHAQAAAEADAESRGLRQRAQELEEEVKAARLAQEQAGLPVSAAAAAAIRATPATPATPAATNGATSASASSSSSTLASSSGASPRGLAMDASFLPSGAESYAANTRSSQLLQQRSEELTSAQAGVKQLERARQALLSEVTTLSTRNAQLEEDAAGVPALQAALTRARSEAEVLMLLLGEKEEEVEAAQADMREVKALYRGQMETLLGATHAAPVAPEEAS
jgi:chromosome segregation ATPase